MVNFRSTSIDTGLETWMSLSNPLFHLDKRNIQLKDERKIRGRSTKQRHNTPMIWKQFCLYWDSLVAQMVKNLTAMQEIRLQSLGWEDLLQKGIGIHSNTLTGEFYGQRSLAGYSPWGPKESEMTGPFTLFTYLYWSVRRINP